ncbi:MAG TPA: sulfate permease, partial [Rhodothermales bacterium]|nr:sulfate permease [Rhodothermales bacterium]
AYAILAGVPPIYGLYASLIPLLVYPLFGTSRQLAVGTIAIDMLIVAAGLSVLAEPGSDQYIALAILLAAMVGVMQIAMGVARLGFVVNLLSRPVITGFASAAALIIAMSQLDSLLGIELPRSQQLHIVLSNAIPHLGEVHLLTLTMGFAAIVVLLVFKRWLPRVPGPLVIVVIGTFLTWKWQLDGQGIAIVGEIPSGLPVPALPLLDSAALGSLWSTALTLALVQFMTVISLGKVFAARHRYTIQPNQEFFAIGAANLAGSLFRGIPISGSFSRTAINADAGARTPLANVCAALLIALTLLFLTSLFTHLPIPMLAAIIIVAAIGLFDFKEILALWRIKRMDGGIAALTFLVTLFVGIQEGVLTGVTASVVAIMYRISRPHVAELGYVREAEVFRDINRHAEAEALDGILLLRVDASFSFANADFIRDLLLKYTQNDANVEAVILDARSINDLDTTAAATLISVAETLRERGVALYFGGVKEPVQDTMRKSDVYAHLGKDYFFSTPEAAARHILQQRKIDAS